jgi:hypothetical protein
MPPTIVLVHGAFAESSSWDGVIDPLLDAGHPVIAAANPLRSLASDAAAVADVVRAVDGPGRCHRRNRPDRFEGRGPPRRGGVRSGGPLARHGVNALTSEELAEVLDSAPVLIDSRTRPHSRTRP